MSKAQSRANRLPVEPKDIIWNPSAAVLRSLTEEMPNTRITAYDNTNTQSRVDARSKLSTFVATDHPERHDSGTISREEYERVSAIQNDYIRTREMILIDGFIGNDPDFRVPARLIIERSNANVAAMQQHLYYPATEDELLDFEPRLTIIYTPNLEMKGYPADRLIAVDLDNGITRVFNSDYFGESKKGGLRMWNQLVYERGGLALHAGCKVIPVGDGNRVGLIIGLSGTGKTTTTFTRQNNSSPVQDDFLALMPGGKVYATENGCFAKTFGLNEKDEPTIYRAVTSTSAYLENVSQNDKGELDFYDTSYTQNGRAVVRMQDIEGMMDARQIDSADFLLILNRNDNIIPGVAKLDRHHAAAYFMLGETRGTSAGGAAEAGKFLRVPGTNPFFPLKHALQGNRFWELLDSSPMDVYLMNTGRVGGRDEDERSRKVRIQHSSAIVKGVAEGTIEWEQDPDFGYRVAKSIPGLGPEDDEILQPRKLYERQGRMDEYRQAVEKLKIERREYMTKWEGLNPEIAEAVS
ncbi:MAG TPA: phosphoenolpyruvate carboxykinase [Blastocatellia bacterium]|jgi:phosphoenolpyruvate carboxykinase (ATP)|nr:phosphoenolpyruvate carboxykinase [Blastocatellia bacterium]